MSWMFSKDITADNISMTKWKDITAEGMLKKILESEETELADDLKMVLNYLRGHLEKIMDSPELILERDELKKEISDLRKETSELKKEIQDFKAELNSIKRDNDVLRRKCSILESKVNLI